MIALLGRWPKEYCMSDETTKTVELAAELTMAWLSNSNTRASSEDVPTFLKSMYDAVNGLASAPVESSEEEAATEYTGAVTARKSLSSPDVIISMIDGKPYKTLMRHLTTNGLTANEYRARYGLKADYPMTAPAYSEMRRDMAKKIGLGRKPGQKVAAKTEVAADAPKRGRPAKPTSTD
jgi:predicted transcriptional regulator